MARLKSLSRFGDLAPAAWKAFNAFNEAALAEGALSVKHKELIAVGVAHATQCAYCIEIHLRKARKAGATEPEIAEAILVAAALRAGGAVAHGAHALDT